MTAVLNGEVSCLWVFALDRFSRKGAEAVVPILGKARVIFDYERLDSMEERDRVWILHQAEQARAASQRLSYNVTKTKTTQRNEGRWLSKAPFGLVLDPATRRLRPDDTPYVCLVESRQEVTPWQVVQRIFKEMANGNAARSLARAFNREGIRSVTGGQWNVNSVRRIIIHPVYEGWLTVMPLPSREPIRYVDPKGREMRCVEKNTIPRMIPEDLAAKARRVLTGNQIMRPRATGGIAFHPLTSRLRCGGCDSAMSIDGRSYICSADKAGLICPDPASAYRPAIEKYVVQQWSDQLHRAGDEDDIMIAVAERWQAIAQPKDSEALRDARAEVKTAKAQLDKFHANDQDPDFYSGYSARYRIPHKNAAEKRMSAAEAKLAELEGSGRVDITFLQEGQAGGLWEKAAPELRRDLIGIAIDAITVTKARNKGPFRGKERVTIVWARSEEATLTELASAA
ncbi:recombinase family protein [Kitasatospora sp. NPDC001574]